MTDKAPSLTKLEEFTKAAMMGYCANVEMAAIGQTCIAQLASKTAKATLEELVKEQPWPRH